MGLRRFAPMYGGLALAAILIIAFADAAAPAIDTYHGLKIVDPYRWLENGTDPRVTAWAHDQDARTHAYLGRLSYYGAMGRELTRLLSGRSAQYSGLTARGPHVFALYEDPAKQQPMLVAMTANADPASRRIVVDPNTLDPKGVTAIEWYVPSGDGTKLAVSLAQNGSEDGTVFLFDAATGKQLEKPLPHVTYPTAGGTLAWTADSSGFWYTRYPDASAPAERQHFYQEVWFHRLGTAQEADTRSLGAGDGLERTSEVFLSNRSSQDIVLAAVQRGDGDTWAYYALSRTAKPIRLATYEDKIQFGAIGPDGALYAISRKGASNGKIVKLKPPFEPGALARAPVIVPEGPVAILSGGAEWGQLDLMLDARHLFVRDIDGGPNRVRVFDLDGKPRGRLPLPPIAANQEIVPLADGSVLFDVQTYVAPTRFVRWEPGNGRSTPTAIVATSIAPTDGIDVVREFATAKDGTKVPVNLMFKKGLKRDGSHPLLLWAYGGFGISQSPVFLGGKLLLFIQAGGIYAEANIRGGGEYGERWHMAAVGPRRQTAFDDYAAVANYVVTRGYTSHKQLVLYGGSNGGLLVGVTLTQHPDIAGSAIAIAGVYDMLGWAARDPNGRFTAPEYGSIDNAADVRAMYAYSPLHHVAKGTAYPAVLLMAGESDGRVPSYHSRKFAAALQAATSSGAPVLLRIDAAGHGYGTSLSQRVAEQTDLLAFLFDRTGLAWK